jgi:hypothetical protein
MDKFERACQAVLNHKTKGVKPMDAKVINKSEVPSKIFQPKNCKHYHIYKMIKDMPKTKALVVNGSKKDIAKIRVSIYGFSDRHKIPLQTTLRNGKLYIAKKAR